MYQPKPGTFFSRRGHVFRCLYIDDISILFENADGERFLDTSGDDFEPASSFEVQLEPWEEEALADGTQVEVWDYSRQKFFPHYRCPGEKRVRVDYHGNLSNLAVFEVTRDGDTFIPVNPHSPLKDWRIDLS